MRRIIRTGYVKPVVPHEWAIAAGHTLYSVHVPIRPDGSIENGDAEHQSEVTFADLKATVQAAGAELADVSIVQIYLTSLEHKPIVDDVYKRYFSEPYPVRACVGVADLPTPETMIEVVATTCLSS